MHPPLFARQGTLLLACGLCTAAWAQDTPPIAVTAAYTVQSEQTSYPDFTTEDQIGRAELGLQFHTIQGLQRIEVDARLVNYAYQTNTVQNHTEANYNAVWHWAVTPLVHGNLEAAQQETPRADAITGDGYVPNRQTQTHYRADIEYGMYGPWQVMAGVSRDQNTSQYTLPNTTDSRSVARDLGLRYHFATGSWIKASLRTADGTYLIGSNATDDSYVQQEQDLRLHWSLNTASSLDLYLTQTERAHQRSAQLDFNASNYGANMNWALSGRSSLVLGYAHTLGAVLGNPGWLTEQDSVSWGWNWQTSSRTQVRIRQALQRIDYRSPVSGGPSGYQDNSHDTSLTLVWTPGTQWQVSAALQQLAHGSSLARQDYTSNQLSFTAQFSF